MDKTKQINEGGKEKNGWFVVKKSTKRIWIVGALLFLGPIVLISFLFYSYSAGSSYHGISYLVLWAVFLFFMSLPIIISVLLGGFIMYKCSKKHTLIIFKVSIILLVGSILLGHVVYFYTDYKVKNELRDYATSIIPKHQGMVELAKEISSTGGDAWSRDYFTKRTAVIEWHANETLFKCYLVTTNTLSNQELRYEQRGCFMEIKNNKIKDLKERETNSWLISYVRGFIEENTLYHPLEFKNLEVHDSNERLCSTNSSIQVKKYSDKNYWVQVHFEDMRRENIYPYATFARITDLTKFFEDNQELKPYADILFSTPNKSLCAGNISKDIFCANIEKNICLSARNFEDRKGETDYMYYQWNDIVLIAMVNSGEIYVVLDYHSAFPLEFWEFDQPYLRDEISKKIK